MPLRYCDNKNKYFQHGDGEKNICLIKQLAKHLILSQGWLIKRNVQNEPFVTKFPFILTNLGIWKSCRRMTQDSMKPYLESLYLLSLNIIYKVQD